MNNSTTLFGIAVYDRNCTRYDTLTGMFPLTYAFDVESVIEKDVRLITDVIIVDWARDGDSKASERPEPYMMEMSIDLAGKIYHPGFWGSNIKTWKMFYVSTSLRDQLLSSGMLKKTADGQRFGRWLLHNSFYANLDMRKLHVKVVSPGTVVNGHLVHKGFSLISRKFARSILNKEEPVKLNRTQEAFQWWQRIPWSTELHNELAPWMIKHIERFKNPLALLQSAPSSYQEKKDLVGLNERMILHPFIVGSLRRQSAEMLARAGGTVCLDAEYKVAIPTAMPYFCWPGHKGKLSISRFPISSDSNIAAFNIKENTDEENRIHRMEVLQGSISSSKFFWKGCLGIVDDLEYDLVLCDDDIKMSTLPMSEVMGVEACVAIGMRWAPGSAFGVNVEWGEQKQQWDCDGDGGHLVDLNQLPILYKAIQSLPDSKNVKLKKISDKYNLDSAISMMRRSMVNLVGQATNLDAKVHQVADLGLLAECAGFKGRAAMLDKVNYMITCGVDGFKTDVDIDAVAKECAQMDTLISKALQEYAYRTGYTGEDIQWAGNAPWTKWPSDDWFEARLPKVDDQDLDSDEMKVSIMGWMDGTVPEIARIMLPVMKDTVGNQIDHEPLMAFRDWARPAYELDDDIHGFVGQYNKKMAKVDWSSSDGGKVLRQWCKNEIEKLVERTNVDRKIVAQHLWYVAHEARGVLNQAAIVFWSMPAEARWITKEMPGYSKIRSQEIILTGIRFQAPSFTGGDLEISIQDLEDPMHPGLIRKAVIAKVPNQHPPKSEHYPKDMLGLVAQNSAQPQAGKYFAHIQLLSNGAHNAVLTKV